LSGGLECWGGGVLALRSGTVSAGRELAHEPDIVVGHDHHPAAAGIERRPALDGRSVAGNEPHLHAQRSGAFVHLSDHAPADEEGPACAGAPLLDLGARGSEGVTKRAGHRRDIRPHHFLRPV